MDSPTELSPEFLALLRCPETRQPLALAPAALLTRLGWVAGLVRADGLVAYPIREGLPILLPDAGVHLPPSPPQL